MTTSKHGWIDRLLVIAYVAIVLYLGHAIVYDAFNLWRYY